MSKLVGPYHRCLFCEYWTNRSYNMTRHLGRRHFPKYMAERQTLMIDGKYQCRMHDAPMIYPKRWQLKRHLYFCHRADEEEVLG